MANKMRLGAHDNLASFPHSICWPIMERCVASLTCLLLALAAGLAAAQGRCCRCSFWKIFCAACLKSSVAEVELNLTFKTVTITTIRLKMSHHFTNNF